MNMQSAALSTTPLPCPRCQREPAYVAIKCADGQTIFGLECACGLEMRSRDGMHELLETWNRSRDTLV